ncbi:MAG: hypothetical protein R3308_03350, partial [Thiohalobacterales bacterium]|nr:hypothetical protein [Thiohalobacterales bacterium]
MMWLIELFVVLAVLSLLMARRASRYLWTGSLAVMLAWWSIAHSPPAWVALLAWIVFTAVAALLLFTPLRENLVT